MSCAHRASRLVVVSGWGVSADMLAELYRYWPGPVELISLDNSWVSHCDSVEELAEALLSRYTEPSVWMGWSLGAQVVMEAACQNTGAVSAVITLAGFPRFVADEHWPHGMSADQFEVFRQGLNKDSKQSWRQFLLLTINGAAARQEERRQLKTWLDKGAPISPDNLCKSLEWLQQTDQRSMWSGADVPALHIAGSCDQVVSDWHGSVQTSPSAIEVSMPGMAHWPGGVSAAACRAAIETFVKTLNGRAS